MRRPKKGYFYIEVRGSDGTVRVSIAPEKLGAIGAIALRQASEAAALLAHNGNRDEMPDMPEVPHA